MFHHLHPDMRVASHLARWGVKARTPEAQAAGVLFPDHKSMGILLRHVYESTPEGKLFVAEFAAESDRGYVGREGSGFSVLEDLRLAHRLSVTVDERARFAAVLEEMARKNLRGTRSFAQDSPFPEQSWELLKQLGDETILDLIMKNVPLLDVSVQFNIRRLLEAEVDRGYFRDVNIFLSPGNMKRGDFAVKEVIVMSDAGVPSSYAAALSKITLPDSVLQSHPILALFQYGVPAPYAVGCIGAGLDLNETFRLWNSGVPLEYATATAA